MADNIYRRGSTWWGRIYVGGKEYRRSLRTTDEATAREAVAQWQRDVAEGGPAGRVTYQQAVVLWHQMQQTATDGEGLKPKTRDRYLTSLRSLDEFFGGMTLDQITARAIGKYVAHRKAGAERVTHATIRRDLTALSSVFRVALAMGLHDRNPAAEWDRTVIKEAKRPQYPPTLEEIEAVASRAQPGLAAIIRFAAYTGVRRNEAVGLEWLTVRLDRGTATLTRTKTNRPRVVRLCSPGGDATGTVTGTARHIRSPLVFWHGDGEPYRNVSGSFRKVQEDLRKENPAFRTFRFHDLRHAFAIRWLENGGDIYGLKEQLGHTSVGTTEIYLRWIDRHTERHSDAGSQERCTKDFRGNSAA